MSCETTLNLIHDDGVAVCQRLDTTNTKLQSIKTSQIAIEKSNLNQEKLLVALLSKLTGASISYDLSGNILINNN